MSKDPKNTNPTKGDPPAGEGDPGKKKEPITGGEVDLSKLSDEQLTKVLEDPRLWKNERLSGLLADQKELKKLKEAQEKAEKEKLEKQGEYKTLLEKTQKELEAAREEAKNQKLRQKIQEVAFSKGIKDVDAASKLIDMSKITTDEETGDVKGVDEAVESLIKDRAYLVTGEPTGNPVGNPSNPGGNPGGAAKFTITQIQDPAFYNEHRDEILKAQREGGITDDRIPAGTPPTS